MLAIRKYRIFNVAIFDLLLAITALMIIYLIAWKIHFPRLRPYIFVLAAILTVIPISIGVHIILGINTTINYQLGLSYIPKMN